jgi:hypothetical protein
MNGNIKAVIEPARPSFSAARNAGILLPRRDMT